MPAVTIDLWHTLIYLPPEDEEAYMTHQLAMGQEVLRASRSLPGAPKVSDADLGRAFERAYEGAVAESVEGRTVTPAEQVLRAGKETGRDPDPRAYLSKLRTEVEGTRFRIAPGALDLLRELRGLGYRVGVISNTIGEPGEFLRPILARMGFDAYVETYVFSDEHPWTKPSPEIFRFALDRLKESPENAVHVGDGWADLEGARRAGFRGAVLFTGLRSYGDRYRKMFLTEVPGEPPAKYRTDRLSEVAGIVRNLLPLS
jgi:HAD superfamily hydrolase (TIGR01509 family)